MMLPRQLKGKPLYPTQLESIQLDCLPHNTISFLRLPFNDNPIS